MKGNMKWWKYNRTHRGRTSYCRIHPWFFSRMPSQVFLFVHYSRSSWCWCWCWCCHLNWLHHTNWFCQIQGPTANDKTTATRNQLTRLVTRKMLECRNNQLKCQMLIYHDCQLPETEQPNHRQKHNYIHNGIPMPKQATSWQAQICNKY